MHSKQNVNQQNLLWIWKNCSSVIFIDIDIDVEIDILFDGSDLHDMQP